MIYNNKYWKGFFPIDQNFDAIRYFGGFWKRFYKEGDIVKGVTHPYDIPSVYVPNLPEIQNIHKGVGASQYKIVICTPEGELHGLACNIIESLLLSKGFKVYNISTSVPTGFILDYIHDLLPDIIFIP